MPSESAVTQLWIWSLAVYFIVVAVVAVLLTMILNATRRITAGAAAIWVVGQKVANNTIHVPLLARTNYVSTRILSSAEAVAGVAEAIAQHAESCPHCPTCVTGRTRKGRG